MPRCDRRPAVLAATFTLASVSCGGPAANTRPQSRSTVTELRRPVHFDPTFRVGDRSRIETAASRTQHRSLTVEGAPARADTNTFMARFEAHARIVAVNARAFPTRVHYEVIHFESERDGQSFETLSSGDRVDLTRADSADSARIAVNDRDATPRQREALGLVLTLTAGEERPSIDDVFGSDEPRSPGDTWTVTDRAATQRMAREFEIDRVLSATAHYTGPVVLRGVNCMDVVTALEGELAPPTGLPAGLEISRAHLRMEGRTRIPFERNVSASQVQFEMLIETQAHGSEAGRAVELEIEGRVQVNAVAMPDDGS